MEYVNAPGVEERVAPLDGDFEARTRRGLLLLAAGLALGALGAQLIGAPPGIGVPLWVGALLLALRLLAAREEGVGAGEGRWLLWAALAFAAGLAWRASEALGVLNVLAVLLALGVGAWWSGPGTPRLAPVGGYVGALLSMALHTLTGPLLLLFSDVRWGEVTRRSRSAQAAALLRGLLLAVPLLVVFGSLLGSADPIFGRILRDLFGVRVQEEVIESLLRTALWGWLAAGFLRTALLRARGETLESWGGTRPGGGGWSLGAVEATVVLALLDALFLGFVLVQFRYLFGGDEVVRAAGMSYAEYARAGFFELVAVAALVLPTLLAADALTAAEGRERRRTVRALSAGLTALVLVVIASAVQRMWLYQAAYGLTEDRLYATAVTGWLATVFVWFAITTLRHRRERFAWGAYLAGLGTCALLNLLNPDALIARSNLSRGDAASRLDVVYLSRLSEDAYPVLLRALPSLPRETGCQLAAALLPRAGTDWLADDGWASWNGSRQRGEVMLRENRETLERLACPREPGMRRSR